MRQKTCLNDDCGSRNRQLEAKADALQLQGLALRLRGYANRVSMVWVIWHVKGAGDLTRPRYLPIELEGTVPFNANNSFLCQLSFRAQRGISAKRFAWVPASGSFGLRPQDDGGAMFRMTEEAVMK